MGLGDRGVVESGQNLAAKLHAALAGHGVHLPGLGVGARGRAGGHFEDVVDRLERYGLGQESANRATGHQRFVGTGTGRMAGLGIEALGIELHAKVSSVECVLLNT